MAKKLESKLAQVSERHHAKRQAAREVANHERIELLKEYASKLRELEALRAAVHSDDALSQTSPADADPLSDGWSQDGEPLRVAIADELAVVDAALDTRPHAAAGLCIPASADNLRATTAAILVVDRGHTEYEAVRSVYGVASSDVADSDKKGTVRRAVARRRMK